MIVAILKDGSRWKPESPTYSASDNAVLRLYRDGHVAGYVLSGAADPSLGSIPSVDARYARNCHTLNP